MASKTKSENTRRLKEHTMRLAVPLTRDEKVERGEQLANVLDDTRNEESRQESMKREMKSALAALEARRDQLASVVARGEELREVQCEDIADFKRGVVETYRLDTGVRVSERALRDEERQLEMAPA